MILDTNALSAYLDSTPEAVEIVSSAHEIAIPVIVAGEFDYGMGSRSRGTAKRMNGRFGGCSRAALSSILRSRPRHYAAIRLELRTAGKQIPANDAWIAALSRQHAML